ncbi:LuxR C-terminal-related transcriptional regulator [Streptomyces bacillaris]|uniref:LuxR C-terminal-related transcriptional regulator n=1 Tax=Streptomyces bacillaris TaxID=68179 RepID=UPI00345FBADB
MSGAVLTGQELAALQLLAGGLTHVQIAAELGVRPETAGRLLHRAQTILRARTLPHAVALAYEAGVLGRTGR